MTTSPLMNTTRPPRKQLRGFSLIELMVAMLLGLIVIGGVTSVFIASRQSYTTNQALGDVQDETRVAFELMARDIRSAGMTGCSNDDRVANVLNNSPTGGGTDWYANWGNALVGYNENQTDPAVTSGTATDDRVASTDSIEIIGADGAGLTVASYDANSAQFKLNETTSDLEDGDIIIVCDPDHATIVQITNYNSSNVTLVHNTGNGTPGNCSKGLGYPTVCTTNGNSYVFPKNSQIAKLTAVDWFVGRNANNGTSLFRSDIQIKSGVPTLTPEEIVPDVTDMQITYHQSGGTSFVAANSVSSWSTVDAAQVTLTLESTNQRAGTDQKPIVRTFTATTTVRNRVL